ncbi:MAG: hypothetical protein F9K40_04935, partial [Kofleriaceae bacterium]
MCGADLEGQRRRGRVPQRQQRRDAPQADQAQRVRQPPVQARRPAHRHLAARGEPPRRRRRSGGVPDAGVELGRRHQRLSARRGRRAPGLPRARGGVQRLVDRAVAARPVRRLRPLVPRDRAGCGPRSRQPDGLQPAVRLRLRRRHAGGELQDEAPRRRDPARHEHRPDHRRLTGELMRSLRFACAALAALVPTAAFAMGGPSPGAVTAQTVKLPSGPGSVRGLADNASVSAFTGQVTYAVPIDLPAGPGGLTPSLSFGYDGGLGNGPLGVGWGMAQAGIQRSLRLGVPHYDATDEIELFGLGAGGQVVSLASGELRIEGQGHAIAGRTVDGGYELTDADGRVYRFGTTAAARKASGANVSAWYLEEIRDVAGNRIVYGYRTDKGEVYLDRIEWGPSVGGARVFRAALEYEPRADAVVSYRTGFRVESALRLARVRVSSFGGTQRIVALAYDDRFPLTRVKSVRVTSGDGVDALPETRFTYAAAEAATQTAVPDVTGWGLNLLGTSLFDVDNDGAMDLLRLHTSGHSWRRNIGGRFAPPAPMPGATGSSLDQVRLVDLDGDSVAEMVRQVGSQWVVHKLDRPSASWISLGALAGAANVSLAGVAIADVDGDRRMDVLAPFGSTIKLRYGTAAGLGAPLSRPAIDPSRPIIQPGAAATSFYDLNGDGLADAIHMASSMFYVYLGRGDGTFEKYRDVAYPWTGSVSASQIRLGDLDRDGLLDVAVVRGGNVAWYRGLANGAFDAAAVAVARPPG